MIRLALALCIVTGCDSLIYDLADQWPSGADLEADPVPTWDSGPPAGAVSCSFDLGSDYFARSIPVTFARSGGVWSLGYSPALIGPAVSFVDASCYDWTDTAPHVVDWTADGAIGWCDFGWCWEFEPDATAGQWSGEAVNGCGDSWPASLTLTGCAY